MVLFRGYSGLRGGGGGGGGGGGVRRRLKGFRGVAGDYKGVEGVEKG